MDTKKTRQMKNEPLDGKPVTALPGVGPALARKLTEKGYVNAVDIYKIYLNYKDSKAKFQKWMKVNGNAWRTQSSTCYDSLKRWDEEFGENESNTNDAPENTQIGTRGSLKGCVRKSGIVAKKKAVQFKKAITKSHATPNYSPENSDTDSTLVLTHTLSKKQENTSNSDPITSFFLSTLETVKTFPLTLQLQVKRQFFDIMINAENKLAEDETEPVASTSHCSPGSSLQPHSSTPGLNNFQHENIASSTFLLNNVQQYNNNSPATPIVINNFKEDNTASSSPGVKSLEQVNGSSTTPTVLNYYSVKREKIDGSPVASTSEIQQPISTTNNRFHDETNETIVLSD